MNHLQYEKSPYLLQHRENPVDWYPWGEEAFARAKKEDKPIFLSIGYSTCHWCHVMAHESFEDAEVAEVLHRSFICIKVDREERPDIDAVYMGVCQMMTGSGGWPLTILMTAEQKPFFAGTYFPKWSQYGMLGLMELLAQVEKLWKTDRKKLLETGEKIASFLQKESTEELAAPTAVLLEQGAAELLQRFDREWGGFGTAPKFPTPHNLFFLLRYGKAEGNAIAVSAVEKSLDAMAQGGIFDQIGGGFSRYSTDEKWLVPHFEKMLYDNGLLAYAYLEGYLQTGKEFYKEIAEETLDYVMRELTDTDGGFFCGQDADSEGTEGKYYVLRPQEIRDVLGEDAEVFCRYFHIMEYGNFEGGSIPNRLGEEAEIRSKKIKELCEKVYAYRKKRTTLHKDDKILTAWNGLMIAAFAKAGFLLENTAYLSAAERAAVFLEERLMDAVSVSWQDNKQSYDATTASIVLPTENQIIAPTGYKFGGWYMTDEADAKMSVTLNPADEAFVLENLTFIAKWIPIEYELTLDFANGTDSETILFTVETTEINLPTPTRYGYSFTGWDKTLSFPMQAAEVTREEAQWVLQQMEERKDNLKVKEH